MQGRNECAVGSGHRRDSDAASARWGRGRTQSWISSAVLMMPSSGASSGSTERAASPSTPERMTAELRPDCGRELRWRPQGVVRHGPGRSGAARKVKGAVKEGSWEGTHSELLDEARERLDPLLGDAGVAKHAAVEAEEALEVQQVAGRGRGDDLRLARSRGECRKQVSARALCSCCTQQCAYRISVCD